MRDRSSWRQRIAIAGLMLAAGAMGAQLSRPSRPAMPASGLPRATLHIEPFGSQNPDSAVSAGQQFADSLAVRIARARELGVTTVDRDADYVLRGDMRTRDHRLVVAARLYRSGTDNPVWSATFWRNEHAGHELLDDLVADVAEALYGDAARHAVIRQGGTR